MRAVGEAPFSPFSDEGRKRLHTSLSSQQLAELLRSQHGQVSLPAQQVYVRSSWPSPPPKKVQAAKIPPLKKSTPPPTKLNHPTWSRRVCAEGGMLSTGHGGTWVCSWMLLSSAGMEEFLGSHPPDQVSKPFLTGQCVVRGARQWGGRCL